MSLDTYFRIPNAVLVFSRGGGVPIPVSDVYVVAYIIDAGNNRWLLIEFPQRRAEDIPLPTARLDPISSCSVFASKIPKTFDFDYHFDDLVCLWSVAGDISMRFALAFCFKRDFDTMRTAIHTPRQRQEGSKVLSHTASMAVGIPSALKELYRQATKAIVRLGRQAETRVDRSARVTNVAALTTRIPSTLRELFHPLVEDIPDVGEDDSADSIEW